MEAIEQYQAIMSEIIQKQSVILGPEIAILKARNVAAIEVGNDGKVTTVSGDPVDALKQLVDEYVNLSGQIVKNTLVSIFKKYPGVEKIS